MAQDQSRALAALIGPSLMAVTAAEAVNLSIFRHTEPQLIFLDGLLLFVAGLAVVRSHNLWSFGWPLLVTLSGWLMLATGLYRLFLPQAPEPAAGAALYDGLALLFAAGAFLTWKGWTRG